jgi:hypothetical protein
MKIRVLRTDIKRGKPGSSSRCPVALAVRRVFGRHPDFTNVSVGLWIIVSNKILDVRIPKVALEFIKRFDAGRKVKPFTFEIKT